jgi:hypothetical protein
MVRYAFVTSHDSCATIAAASKISDACVDLGIRLRLAAAWK